MGSNPQSIRALEPNFNKLLEEAMREFGAAEAEINMTSKGHR